MRVAHALPAVAKFLRHKTRIYFCAVPDRPGYRGGIHQICDYCFVEIQGGAAIKTADEVAPLQQGRSDNLSNSAGAAGKRNALRPSGGNYGSFNYGHRSSIAEPQFVAAFPWCYHAWQRSQVTLS